MDLKKHLIAVHRHEDNVRELGCIITQSPFPTMHHCHGGSIKDAGWHVGMGQKQNPFLQIPLHMTYHTGQLGIDSGMGVLTWEKRFGTQMEHLECVNHQLPYDLFELAKRWEISKRRNTATRRFGMETVISIARQSEPDT